MVETGGAGETILVSRTDRAGDVILTLPVLAAIRQEWPQARILAHVRTYTAPLLEGHPDCDGLVLDDPSGKTDSLRHLARRLRRECFTAAVLVHPSARVVVASWLAGIPVRTGRALHGWRLFLNRPVVQHRSRNEKHESAYNVDLLQGLGMAAVPSRPAVAPSTAALAFGRQRLGQAGMRSPMVFVHPGHGGSAFNLPVARYRELVGRLRAAGWPVVLTLGPEESGLAAEFPPPARGFAVVNDVPHLGLLAGLLAQGMAFVGGSTGPMHLAAAVGLPVASFFALFGSMTPVRWGPLAACRLILTPPAASSSAAAAGEAIAKIPLEPVLEWMATLPTGRGHP